MKINPYLNKTQLAFRESVISFDELAVWNTNYRIVLRKVGMDMRVMVRRPVLAIHAHFQSGKFRQRRHRHLQSAERGKETVLGWRNANRSSFADSISSLSSSTSLSARGFSPKRRIFYTIPLLLVKVRQRTKRARTSQMDLCTVTFPPALSTFWPEASLRTTFRRTQSHTAAARASS